MASPSETVSAVTTMAGLTVAGGMVPRVAVALGMASDGMVPRVAVALGMASDGMVPRVAVALGTASDGMVPRVAVLLGTAAVGNPASGKPAGAMVVGEKAPEVIVARLIAAVRTRASGLIAAARMPQGTAVAGTAAGQAMAGRMARRPANSRTGHTRGRDLTIRLAAPIAARLMGTRPDQVVRRSQAERGRPGNK
jgi:hypothetical protein